jgi:sulfite dehydrogenase
MKVCTKICALLPLVLTIALSCPSIAHALDIVLPPETATYQPSELPGYQLVLQNCLICHAAQYAQYQPPASSRAYWDATVRKMKKPFGAPVPDDAIAPIVDYLVKTYGAEQTTPKQ